MSRFAYITEDPDYENWDDSNAEQDIMEWLNKEIDGAIVVKKPQEEFSPFETCNS